MGSRNGTYVNGARISGRTLVHAGDEIGLGSFHFQLLEDGALAKREYIGNVTIEVNSVAVNAPNGDRLLDSISLTVFPSELVALMGPAGAGKTTFLKAINENMSCCRTCVVQRRRSLPVLRPLPHANELCAAG